MSAIVFNEAENVRTESTSNFHEKIVESNEELRNATERLSSAVYYGVLAYAENAGIPEFAIEQVPFGRSNPVKMFRLATGLKLSLEALGYECDGVSGKAYTPESISKALPMMEKAIAAWNVVAYGEKMRSQNPSRCGLHSRGEEDKSVVYRHVAVRCRDERHVRKKVETMPEAERMSHCSWWNITNAHPRGFRMMN